MITTEEYTPRCNCRSVGECYHGLGAEENALNALVDEFAKEMKRKLQEKRLEGYHGWDDPEYKEELERLLREHVNKEGAQMVDVANFAAMLWNMRGVG